MTRARSLAGGLLLLAAGTAGVGVIAATDAAAASCGAITISASQNFGFDVSSVTVQRGGCVRFANLTDVTVTVTVSGSSFKERLPARTPASASAAYTANRSATVTATDGVRSGHGSIDVESAGSTSAPDPTPTPTRATVIPPPHSSTVPKPSTKPSRGSAGSQLPGSGSTEAPAAVNTQHAIALPGLPAPPPPPATSKAAPPAASHPVVAPQVKHDAVSTDPRLTSTVLEPVGGSGRGLPATVAAVLLLGLAAAYGRTVLVAGEAVDSSRRPHPLRPTV